MSTLNTSNDLDIELCSALGNANGASVFPSGQRSVAFPRGSNPFALYVWGTFGGTAKLQVSPDNGTTWIDYPGATFTAAGIFAPVYLGAQNAVRMTNTAGSVNATLSPVV